MRVNAEPVGVGDQIPRNSLALLMVAQALVVLPLARHLSLWIVGVGLFCGYWRWMVFQGRWDYPKRWVKVVLVVCSAVGVGVGEGGAFSLETAASLLVVAFALKLLETKTRRDAYLVIFLGYFVVATEFLFDQTMLTAGYEIVAFVAVTAAMIGLNQMHARVRPLKSLHLAGVLVAQAIPLMLVLFLFFPRVAPLWSVPLPGAAHTGITDRSTPGDIARLTQSDEIAFRVVFDGVAPNPRALYWRGMVYSRFDEGEWSLGPLPALALQVDRFGLDAARGFLPDTDGLRRLEYQVLIEPTQSRWLFGMDVALPASGDVVVRRDFRLESTRALTSLSRYEVHSFPDAVMDVELPNWLRRRETALPESDNPRTVAFAAALFAEANGPRDYIARVLRWIRQQPYVYTLEPTVLPRVNSIDRFWFDTRRGFCAHYAGAFVYLMRAAGVPARMVGGYLGGEINPVTGHLVVRQYDAHAWAEVWLEGEGWMRFDPTAAVAPARIEQGLMEALSSEDRAALSAFANARLHGTPYLSDLLYVFESMEHRWNLWVVGYDAGRQSRYLEELLGEITPTRIGLALLAGGGLSLALVVASLFWRRRAAMVHPGIRAFRRFAARLERHGSSRNASESPSAFVRRIAGERGIGSAQADPLIEQLESVLYNPSADPSAAALRRLKRGLNRFVIQSALRSTG